MRQTFALIDLSNLNFNYLNIRKKVKQSKILAVVKADAYGHGVERVVVSLNSLNKNQPDYYGVAIAEEGIELRKLSVHQPILVFEPISDFNVKDIIDNYLIPTVFDDLHISILKKNIKNKKVKVQIKIDTGMGRIGVNFNSAVSFIKNLVRNDFIDLDGIYTHFATSDEKDKTFANLQLKRFKEIIYQLKYEKINCGLIHCANSGAILDLPDAYFDMVRPGISLYGYYPSQETSESIKLKPVMSLISKVNSKRKFDVGESVSYGRKFIVKSETNIISVPIGYADGFNRNLTNKVKALIQGKFYNQVGKVSMDRIMFDVGTDKINLNDEVVLIGSQNKKHITAWDWCKVLNTIPYEITCCITKRVPRVYIS